MDKKTIIIIGGGAAGFFAAIECSKVGLNERVIILEQSSDVLHKVRISGGGRCNVTHACFDPRTLTGFYPRGHKELLGPFHVFGPSDTVQWFEARGVKLKTEQDGRMFPVSDDSSSIVNCLKYAATSKGVEILTKMKVKDLTFPESDDGFFIVHTSIGDFSASKVLIASGSAPSMWKILEAKGYRIIEPVPSLFTFNIADKYLHSLAGISFSNVEFAITGTKISTQGPLLITHWGLSGPAVLKASAWWARELYKLDYTFEIQIDWLPAVNADEIQALKSLISKKKIFSNPQFGLATRFWQYIISKAEIDTETNWASVNGEKLRQLIRLLKASKYTVTGKSTFKEEFVTAGGVDLKQVDFKTFRSKLHPGLYFAGEVLNIDALTGGFNFQAAWTGGYIAGKAMSGIPD